MLRLDHETVSLIRKDLDTTLESFFSRWGLVGKVGRISFRPDDGTLISKISAVVEESKQEKEKEIFSELGIHVGYRFDFQGEIFKVDGFREGKRTKRNPDRLWITATSEKNGKRYRFTKGQIREQTKKV